MPSWQVLNTVAHIAAYFGNKIGKQFDTGEYFETRDGITYPRNSQHAIIVLSAKPKQLPEFAASARAADDVKTMYFIRDMIETNSDEEIVGWLAKKENSDVELLGVGIYGENSRLKELTSQFRLWS